ncbi:hypothetical protein BC833DRAFT_585270 [Globomyces pollinis-pini]|nr:hypothetical protein BC833DRAFT_585270 [Globomyces pollinis-pini]
MGDEKNPLPPPESWNQKLKDTGLKIFNEWKVKFYSNHRQLGFLLDHAKSLHHTNHVEGNNEFELQQSTLKQMKEERTKEIRFRKYLDLMNDTFTTSIQDIEGYATQLRNCLNILIPNLEEENVNAVDEKLTNVNSHINYGLASRDYTLNIEIEKNQTIIENNENKSVFDSLRENRQMLQKYQVKIDEWLSIATKADDPDVPRHEKFLKTLIDLKLNLSNMLLKSDKLLNMAVIEDDSDEDEEFVEVDNEAISQNLESDVNSNLNQDTKEIINDNPVVTRKTKGLAMVFKNHDHDEYEHDITLKKQDSNETDILDTPTLKESKGKIKAEYQDLVRLAPEVPYDQDLDYWGKEEIQFHEVSRNAGIDFHHRFLGEGSSDQKLSSESVSNLKKRTIYVEQQTEAPEYPECRYPVRNGRLCPRRDMEVCPFHGPIIPRDIYGTPLDPNHKDVVKKPKSVWQEIESQVNLNVEDSNSKKPKLDPLPKSKTTVRTRLLRKASKLSKNAPHDPSDEHKNRDRNAFRW